MFSSPQWQMATSLVLASKTLFSVVKPPWLKGDPPSPPGGIFQLLPDFKRGRFCSHQRGIKQAFALWCTSTQGRCPVLSQQPKEKLSGKALGNKKSHPRACSTAGAESLTFQDVPLLQFLCRGPLAQPPTEKVQEKFLDHVIASLGH